MNAFTYLNKQLVIQTWHWPWHWLDKTQNDDEDADLYEGFAVLLEQGLQKNS